MSSPDASRPDALHSTLLSTYPVPDSFAANARVDRAEYERLYAESLRDPDAFWGRVAQRLDWDKPPTQV